MHKKHARILSLELAAALALILTFVAQMLPFCRGCQNLYDNMLRLHVIAASDSNEDQRLKLLVRDTLLREGASVFDGSADVQSAKEKLTPHFRELEQAAERVLQENGSSDSVRVSLEKTYFDTRSYGSMTVPAGTYEAVCVRIGAAKGHNWWCVMFPPLCLPAVSEPTDAVFSTDGRAVLGSSPRYDVRFKVVELYQSAKTKLHK